MRSNIWDIYLNWVIFTLAAINYAIFLFGIQSLQILPFDIHFGWFHPVNEDWPFKIYHKTIFLSPNFPLIHFTCDPIPFISMSPLISRKLPISPFYYISYKSLFFAKKSSFLQGNFKKIPKKFKITIRGLIKIITKNIFKPLK